MWIIKYMTQQDQLIADEIITSTDSEQLMVNYFVNYLVSPFYIKSVPVKNKIACKIGKYMVYTSLSSVRWFHIETGTAVVLVTQ